MKNIKLGCVQLLMEIYSGHKTTTKTNTEHATSNDKYDELAIRMSYEPYTINCGRCIMAMDSNGIFQSDGSVLQQLLQL